MKSIYSVLVVTVLGACGGKAANSPASNDPNDCGVVATKIVAAAELSGEAKQKAHAALAGTCTTGDWSVEARACFVQASDQPAVSACGDKLTAEQKQDLVESLGGDPAGGSAEPAPASPEG